MWLHVEDLTWLLCMVTLCICYVQYYKSIGDFMKNHGEYGYLASNKYDGCEFYDLPT